MNDKPEPTQDAGREWEVFEYGWQDEDDLWSLKGLGTPIVELPKAFSRWITALEAENAALRLETLRAKAAYAQHLESCDLRAYLKLSTDKCTCGYDALTTEASPNE